MRTIIGLVAVLAVAAGKHVLDGPDLVPHPRPTLGWAPVQCPLPTPYTAKVDPANPKPEYPRPQLVRNDSAITLSLNGIWAWQPAENTPGPVPTVLNSSILVPFPVESCLSGVNQTYTGMWYRLANVTAPSGFTAGDRLLLHVEASDWQTTVFVDGQQAGAAHANGYSRFPRDVTTLASNPQAFDIAIHVFDPSDSGTQPFGKQQVSAITQPHGDRYTPSSGIWGSVWLESVPASYISHVGVVPSLTSLRVNVSAVNGVAEIAPGGATVAVTVTDPFGKVVASASGDVAVPIDIAIPGPQALWTPETPNLYSIEVDLVAVSTGPLAAPVDSARTYAGMRTVGLGMDGSGITRPLLNGRAVFFNGWLDQGWWPDGQYSAPTDAGLLSDLQAVKTYGLNTIRKHQKIESMRYYFHTATLGIMLWQDFVQHFHGNGDFDIFLSEGLQAVRDLHSEPSIVQWEIFNEHDCVTDPGFNPPVALAALRAADDTRLIDLSSGGPPQWSLLGDVNDIHHYSPPAFPSPSDTEYASIGEFGGVGLFIDGHMWPLGKCYGYQPVSTPAELVTLVMQYLDSVQAAQNTTSAAIYTQTTDVETECDGPMLNYDRTRKLTQDQVTTLAAMNQKLIHDFPARVGPVKAL